MDGKKRDTRTDIPRRIYKTTIERMDKHLDARSRTTRTGIKRQVKGDFNKFLILLIDFFEGMQDAEVFYATKLYKDPSEARGEAILQAVKSKTPVEFPKMVVIMGDDET